jgi:hypothetical protein
MKALVKGKRVALVGRAGSILGTGAGPKIDAADVVVRVNWLMLPIPDEYAPDVGTRTDLVYTCMVCATARRTAEANGIPWKRASGGRRARISARLFPKKQVFRISTGCLAAVDLLRAGAKSVHLHGFDLMKSEHYQERTPDGNNPNGSRSGRWVHNWELERRAWLKLLKKHRGRLVPDRVFREALGL